MNDVPFWLPGVLTVTLTVGVSAFLLPIAETLYRAANWLLTWPLPAWERAERRDAFELQLDAFLAEERRKGYQPQSSGLRLLVRMLTTLPVDIWDAARGLWHFLSDIHASVGLRLVFTVAFGILRMVVIILWLVSSSSLGVFVSGLTPIARMSARYGREIAILFARLALNTISAAIFWAALWRPNKPVGG